MNTVLNIMLLEIIKIEVIYMLFIENLIFFSIFFICIFLFFYIVNNINTTINLLAYLRYFK
jgi:hypothetical protein